MKSFKTFLNEQKNKHMFFTFGRMNPPTIGHEKLIEALSDEADGRPYRVYLSPSHDKSKNPLMHESKVKHARRMFHRHGRSICGESVSDVLEAAVSIYEDGYTSITMVVGEDRVDEFDALLNKYNGQETRKGIYVFESINVVSAGHRDPDTAGVESSSATSLREAARQNDFTKFSQGLPKNVSTKDAKSLYNEVRLGMGLTEEKHFRTHLDVGSGSELREKYIRGELFEVGDEVVINESEEVGTVRVLGSNYVIVETADKRRLRKWLQDVKRIEA